MKQFLIAAIFALMTTMPATAEQPAEPNMIEKGARLFFEGLLQELQPGLDDLEGYSAEVAPKVKNLVRDMAPALRQLMAKVQDWSQYHPPEILPNGDIVMRRKSPEDVVQEHHDAVDL